MSQSRGSIADNDRKRVKLNRLKLYGYCSIQWLIYIFSISVFHSFTSGFFTFWMKNDSREVSLTVERLQICGFWLSLGARGMRRLFCEDKISKYLEARNCVTDNKKKMFVFGFKRLNWFSFIAIQPQTKRLRQFHLFSNFCCLLLSPLNRKSKPPHHPLFKVVLV